MLLSELKERHSKVLNLKQGSDEWKAKRMESFTASEAGAMMNASDAYMSRSELLKMKHEKKEKPVSDYMQGIFDKGHAMEALARPIAEKRIGGELYPVTIVNGKLLASMDGIDAFLNYKKGWEHKAPVMSDKAYDMAVAGEIPENTKWQMDQQLMVSRAESILYMVSDGTESKMATIEYFPNPERFQMLLDGWEQFEKDLENYESTSAAPAEFPAAAMPTLPALLVDRVGQELETTVGLVKTTLGDFIANVNMLPETEQDFADSEAAVKFCSEAETALKESKVSALLKYPEIGVFFDTVDTLVGEVSKTRLFINKKVTAEKVRKKTELIGDAVAKVFDRATDPDLYNLDEVEAKMTGAIKGKRSTQGCLDALDAEVANQLSSPPAPPAPVVSDYAKGYMDAMRQAIAQASHRKLETQKSIAETSGLTIKDISGMIKELRLLIP